jgi:hypothetical protein
MLRRIAVPRVLLSLAGCGAMRNVSELTDRVRVFGGAPHASTKT